MPGTFKKPSVILRACILICLLAVLILLYNGVIQINHPPYELYPVRGVDVSHYQGDIDWGILSGQGIRFAFIKATEGTDFTDEKFLSNREGAQKAGLRVGAYHFFSLVSPGAEQAEHFFSVAGPTEDMLPPVVDVEPYGRWKNTDIDTGALLSELESCLEALDEKYGMRPIIYTTKDWYPFIHERFPEHDIWIRSVVFGPSKNIEWKFWQYSDRKTLSGYNGKERFIDMDLFRGSEEEFERYPNG